MKKILIILGIIIALIIAYFLISPLFINKKVMEDFPGSNDLQSTQTSKQDDFSTKTDKETGATIFQGEFSGLVGHKAQGTASLIEVGGKNFIRFENNFEVTNGPDLVVYLGKDNKYDEKAELGELKGNIGSQNYEIPTSLDLNNYNEVWVWCRAFSVPFGKAELK